MRILITYHHGLIEKVVQCFFIPRHNYLRNAQTTAPGPEFPNRGNRPMRNVCANPALSIRVLLRPHQPLSPIIQIGLPRSGHFPGMPPCLAFPRTWQEKRSFPRRVASKTARCHRPGKVPLRHHRKETRGSGGDRPCFEPEC